VIDAEKANYPIAWMCRLLGVPRSSFYAWRNYLCHPFIVHTATWPHRGTVPRIIVQPAGQVRDGVRDRRN
jgi:hypothetical protein